jgi:hypothetical protein
MLSGTMHCVMLVSLGLNMPLNMLVTRRCSRWVEGFISHPPLLLLQWSRFLLPFQRSRFLVLLLQRSRFLVLLLQRSRFLVLHLQRSRLLRLEEDQRGFLPLRSQLLLWLERS